MRRHQGIVIERAEYITKAPLALAVTPPRGYFCYQVDNDTEPAAGMKQ